MTLALERDTRPHVTEPTVQTEPELPVSELKGRVTAMGETVNKWLAQAGATHSPDRSSAGQTQPDGTRWEVKDVAVSDDLPRSRRIAGRWIQVERRTSNEVTTVELVAPFPTTDTRALPPTASLTRSRYVHGQTFDVSPQPDSHAAVTIAEKLVAELSGIEPAPRAPRTRDMRTSMRRSLLRKVF